MSPEIFVGLNNKTGLSLRGRSTSDIKLLEIISEEMNVSLNRLISDTKTRKREFVYSRQLFFFFKKQMTTDSLESIGMVLGKHHASVIHSIKNVENLIDTDKTYRKLIDKMTYRIVIEGNRESKTEEIMNKQQSA